MLIIATCLGVGLIAVLTEPVPGGEYNNATLKLKLQMVVVNYIVAKESAICQALAQVVIRSLLFVSGDVELNPV